MKKTCILAVCMAVLGILFIGCQGQPGNGKEELVRYNANFFDVFDTQTTVVGYAKSQEEFDGKIELLKEKLVHYHQLYDIYHTYEGVNNIKTINDNAGMEPVKVEQEIIDLLKMSKEMYRVTSGKVNVAMGSVLNIWHEYRDFGRENPDQASLPEPRELEQAAEHMDIDKLLIDEKNKTVYLEDSQMSLDVGGVGKGYAVQKATEYAKEIGLTDCLISVGGNVCALGVKQDGSQWKIGIENPGLDIEDAYIEKVFVKERCVVTSGDYQRYYTVDGIRYCHIIDPDTLMPASHYASVTIIAKDSGVADALSTALFTMNLEDGMSLIDSIEDAEAMWVYKDGEIHYSKGFPSYND